MSRLPYTEAVVLEGLRIFLGNTFGLPHRALQDTVLCGYKVPKVFLFKLIYLTLSREYFAKTLLHLNHEGFVGNCMFCWHDDGH